MYLEDTFARRKNANFKKSDVEKRIGDGDVFEILEDMNESSIVEVICESICLARRRLKDTSIMRNVIVHLIRFRCSYFSEIFAGVLDRYGVLIAKVMYAVQRNT